ncbi:hypothetical protein RFI_20716 [Reticulomyxa filosa]|uniref:Uncharacterized protein n=1 Tax=Reticulomyxa filosa TaxID=46433 RepID=X6MT42_RETFI|nr:hypothetical protein RFI_20716 [Reticulomyxa filosa]|eukprot:ETO16622.1 hypothetical protein RFI_20716 [Reticulomyxa filosa]
MNEYRQILLHLAINNKHWVGYCTRVCCQCFHFENIMELIMKYKNDKNNKGYLDAMNICKWILKQRAIYLMKRIEYAMDYVKDKLVDEDYIIKFIDEILLQLSYWENSIKLPRDTTFESVYKKGMKEFQVQVTTLLGLCYH